jgi:integrase
MPAYRDKNTGKWFVFFYYRDREGQNRGKTKRGFETKRAALDFEREFKMVQSTDLQMTFESFVKVYEADVRPRLKENTWHGKQCIIEHKLLPYFGRMQMNQIKAADIIRWQNHQLGLRRKDGTPYSGIYLRSINVQLNTIFNHAVMYYDLKSSPAAKVKTMGKGSSGEMNFWTREEYAKFAAVASGNENKAGEAFAFEVLYWCGLRLGEMLALTPADIDTEARTITVNKSLQRIHKRDVITDPKTEKSNRVVSIPDTLAVKLREHLKDRQPLDADDRLFPFSKSHMHVVMSRTAAAAGVKRIRIHDLRHSHVSLLIELGFSALAIADRVGHESIEITYRYAHLFPSKHTDMAEKLDAEMREELGSC